MSSNWNKKHMSKYDFGFFYGFGKYLNENTFLLIIQLYQFIFFTFYDIKNASLLHVSL